MLDRAATVGTDRPVQWQQADAARLPFDDASFDIVVCQFGVMFFPDKARAFAEARQVLRRGGAQPGDISPRAGHRLLPGHALAQRNRGARGCNCGRRHRGVHRCNRPALRPGCGGRKDSGAHRHRRQLTAPGLMRSKRRAAPSVSHPLGGRTTYVVGLGALSITSPRTSPTPRKRSCRPGWRWPPRLRCRTSRARGGWLRLRPRAGSPARLRGRRTAGPRWRCRSRRASAREVCHQHVEKQFELERAA